MTINPHFDGKTYSPTLDHARLTGQLGAVYDVMKDGQWYALWQIQDRVKGSESSIGARIRDLRKEKFGGHTVERKRKAGGSWQYRLVVA